MTLSLGMIFRNEADQFERIMRDYHWLFDEVVIAVDEDIEKFNIIAKNYPKISFKILPFVWVNDFGKKRQLVHENITSDYYVRLDADDEIDTSCVKGIRKIAEDAKDNGISIVYGFYNYSRDDWGNTNAAQWREVIIKNSSNLYWNKKIHENVLPKNTSNHNVDLCDKLIINHLVDEKHIEMSLQRNIKYLLEEYKQDGDKTDPRTIAYLGRMLSGIRQFDKAIYFLQKHIELSGWDEDRYTSWCQLSECFIQKGDYKNAEAAVFEALAECPDYPDAYLKMHDIYFNQEKWQKAETWGRQGLMKPIPKNFMMSDPSSYGWRPILSMALTLFQLSKFDEALKLFNIAKKDVPTLDFVVENEKMFRMAVEHKAFMENYLAVLNYLKDNNEDHKIPALLEAAPEGLKDNEILIRMKNVFLKPKEWSDKSVCIFAVNSLQDWSPKSVDEGIGGSEEAVIYLSKELVKQGWEVTVFNNCGENEGIYEGVEYRNVVKFNPRDSYNIVISWRTNIFSNDFKANKKIIWIHDLPTNMKFDEDSLKDIDKVVVLSQYHASLLPKNVPAEKVFITSNGINAEDFVGLDSVKREKHRIVYASSYNRGLEQLLEMWPDIRKAVHDAELHTYYGWETYDAFMKQGFGKDNGFKAKMLKLMDQPGVTDHGRVGHKQLLREYAKASVFAYPCSYSGEINCIALTKAIACGCVAVTNDFAVMDERNPYPTCSDAEFKDRLIATLKNPICSFDKEEYIKENSWEAIAVDWSKRLFIFGLPVTLTDRLKWIRSNVDKSSKIIDIGCNKGHLFFDWDHKNIYSVDIDKYDLPNFTQLDASKPLPFADKEFDVAVLAEITEHTDDPISVIREAMRVSKKLIITVPWEHKWRSEFRPFSGADKIDAMVKNEKVSNRLELARVGNPNAIEFYDKDGFEHLWHKQFYTPELLREHLKMADITDYKMVEIRSNMTCLGVICESCK